MTTKIEIDDNSLDSSGGDDLMRMVDDKSLEGSEDTYSVRPMYGDEDLTCSLKDIAGNTITYKFVPVNGEEMNGVQSSAILQSADTGGQYLVIGNPNDVFGSGSPAQKILPKENIGKITINSKLQEKQSKTALNTSGLRGQRDDKRRATHNEVERRRRDKINTWIGKLGALVPDLDGTLSKGGILSHACDYIVHLTEEQDRLQICLAENEKLKAELSKARQEINNVKKENSHLRIQLESRGSRRPLDPLDDSNS